MVIATTANMSLPRKTSEFHELDQCNMLPMATNFFAKLDPSIDLHLELTLLQEIGARYCYKSVDLPDVDI